ncbi:MAG: hypothetical protein HZB68_01470 [Candidatus Aenigmarchaeota archaeon]|nr:hypothetical protein [Candidatus Aenigmarchaeota archaeon]
METDKMYESWLKERNNNSYRVCSIDDLINLTLKQETYEKNVIVKGKIGKKSLPAGERGYICFTIEDEKTGKSIISSTSVSQSCDYHYDALSEVGDSVSIAGVYSPRKMLLSAQYMFNKSLMKDMLNESGDKGDKNGT